MKVTNNNTSNLSEHKKHENLFCKTETQKTMKQA